jgi:predicted esterase
MEQFLISPIRRYFELEEPHSNRPKKRSPLLIALHGYQGDKDSMMRLAHRIGNGKMVVISLQGPYQFFIRNGDDPKNVRIGFGWGTTWKMAESVSLHHRDLRGLISLASQKYHADPGKVFLLGFSQACSYNYRFALAYPHAVKGVIAVCGGVPNEWMENRHSKRIPAHVLHIAATRDEWYSREKNLQFRRQLAQRAESLDFRFYNSPHKFPRTSLPHIRKWIDRHL